MNGKSIIVLSIILLVGYLLPAQDWEEVQINEDLLIRQLSPHTYVHISYTVFEPYGRVASNGLIYRKGNVCLIFDTPATAALTDELIAWLEKEEVSIEGVIINHFHADCLAGLKSFQDRGIVSYSSKATQALTRKEDLPVPSEAFEKVQKLKLAGSKVINFYPGEAHAPDNIVSYIPAEKVLFGGCMVKSLKSGKGNLGDANTQTWASSIEAVQKKFPKVQWVVPGHGQAGGKDLLEYTIDMFSQP